MDSPLSAGGSARSLWCFALVFATTAVFYISSALSWPMLFIWATYENLVGEWTQFALFLLAGLAAFRAALRVIAYRRFLLLLGFACLFVALEEVSWGQQVFGWTSPQLFEQHNLQGETNFHNFLTGPVSSGLKDSLEILLAASLALYGLVYPLGLKRRHGWALRLNAWGVLPPPLYLSPFFAGSAILELQPFSFNEAEVAELWIGIALLAAALHYRPLPPRGQPYVDQLVAVFAAVCIGVSLTVTTMLIPDAQQRTLTRIDAGIEKFADRYESIGRWGLIAELYEHKRKRHPDSTSTLRSLAIARLRSGDRAGYEETLTTALEIDASRLKGDPHRASVNRSLYRTYRALRQHEEAKAHADAALAADLARIEANPDNANAHYSIGKTYWLVGDRIQAKIHFEVAASLRPQSKDFADALLMATR